MVESAPARPAGRLAPERCLPWLLLLFFGSGCAALIYEIVWFQLLQLVVGSSAVSLGVLLGTYMGGMCLGSLLLPRFVSARQHPLRVYALLELGIGVLGLGVLFAMPLVSGFYVEHAGHGPGNLFLRGLLCCVLLLPPTLLMGASLPAIGRWVEATPRGVSWLGFFYGGNIAGAVFGCLLAGFYLLRVYDMTTASLVAAALDIGVAVVGLGLAAASAGAAAPPAEPVTAPDAGPPAPPPSPGWVYGVIAVSGLTALGAEVVWTRLLSLLLGGTVYTFSLILSVFLTGLGLGSGLGAALARRRLSPRLLLGVCQLLLVGAMAWTAYSLTRLLPFSSFPHSANPWTEFRLDLLRLVPAILPAACLWGASFPLALAAAAARGADAGRLVGTVYAANTLGAIAGAAATPILLIAWFGTQRAQQVLMALSTLAGFVALVPFLGPGSAEKPRRPGAGPAVLLGLALAAALVLITTVVPVPWQLVAYGRGAATDGEGARPLFVGEGMNASVAVTRLSSGSRSFHISGKVEASSGFQDMRLQRMLGHLPAVFHPRPKSVLIVGCGAGVTAGSFVRHPEIERIVLCELEPLIPRVVANYFGEENHHLLKDPRVQVVYDDARHFVLTTREKFDIITSDPIHPWVKGAATLYTQEYFELCKRRLNPGGLVTQWVPLYESTPAVVKSEMATFGRAFPGATIWSNDDLGDGYDVVMLGQTDPLVVDVDRLQQRLDDPVYSGVRQSLREVSLGSAFSLLSTYAGRVSDLGPWLQNAEINHDSNLRLQYLAGLGLNQESGIAIYDDLLGYRRFPEGLLVGKAATLDPLRGQLEGYGFGNPYPPSMYKYLE